MTKESYPIKFDLSQYYKIKRIIESSDVFFASLFDLTNIYFSENAQTAQITFDKQGNSLNMEINPHFWSKLQEDEKTFIIISNDHCYGFLWWKNSHVFIELVFL